MKKTIIHGYVIETLHKFYSLQLYNNETEQFDDITDQFDTWQEAREQISKRPEYDDPDIICEHDNAFSQGCIRLFGDSGIWKILDKIVKDNKNKYEQINFEWDTDDGYINYPVLVGYRDPTEEEIAEFELEKERKKEAAARKKIEKKQKQELLKQERELKLLNDLKAKYENKD